MKINFTVGSVETLEELAWHQQLHKILLSLTPSAFEHLAQRLLRESGFIQVQVTVKNMMANHKLAKTIADCGWAESLRQLEYKCQWHGRTIGAIDRWFPSVKIVCLDFTGRCGAS